MQIQILEFCTTLQPQRISWQQTSETS